MVLPLALSFLPSRPLPSDSKFLCPSLPFAPALDFSLLTSRHSFPLLLRVRSSVHWHSLARTPSHFTVLLKCPPTLSVNLILTPRFPIVQCGSTNTDSKTNLSNWWDQSVGKVAELHSSFQNQLQSLSLLPLSLLWAVLFRIRHSGSCCPTHPDPITD